MAGKWRSIPSGATVLLEKSSGKSTARIPLTSGQVITLQISTGSIISLDVNLGNLITLDSADLLDDTFRPASHSSDPALEIAREQCGQAYKVLCTSSVRRAASSIRLTGSRKTVKPRRRRGARMPSCWISTPCKSRAKPRAEPINYVQALSCQQSCYRLSVVSAGRTTAENNSILVKELTVGP